MKYNPSEQHPHPPSTPQAHELDPGACSARPAHCAAHHRVEAKVAIDVAVPGVIPGGEALGWVEGGGAQKG